MIGYWCVVVLMLDSVMASCGYEFRQGVFLSTTMLPGMFCAKLSLPGALRASNRRAVAVAGVAGGILVIEWLALLLAHRYIWSGWLPGDGMVFHVLFYNPVFIGLLLAAVLIPERLLDRWIKARLPRMETVSFISERRKVTLPVGELLYVESNDTEVFLHTADGGLYPTRTRISQWERLLDDRFIRIHRAWLVNAERVSRVTMTDVTIERVTLEVSRKYRNAVAERFGLHKPAR